MNAPLHHPVPGDRRDRSIHLGTWVLGIVCALATGAALASFLILGSAEPPQPLAAVPPAATFSAGATGAALWIDHSALLAPGLQDDTLEPGASIAAYDAP